MKRPNLPLKFPVYAVGFSEFYMNYNVCILYARQWHMARSTLPPTNSPGPLPSMRYFLM